MTIQIYTEYMVLASIDTLYIYILTLLPTMHCLLMLRGRQGIVYCLTFCTLGTGDHSSIRIGTVFSVSTFGHSLTEIQTQQLAPVERKATMERSYKLPVSNYSN